jgi:MraZ protein
MLIGEFRHTIDAKKRLALPAKFRKELGRSVIVTKGINNCLSVYTEKEWEIMSDKLGKLPVSQPEARGFARVILAGATEAELDKLGRILLPEYLKEYASLGKNVVITGLVNRLEIWNEEKWDSYKSEAEKNVDDLASKLGQMGI